MPMSVYGPGGTPRAVRAFSVYGPGGTPRAVKNAWVYGPGGTPRLFFSSGGFQLTAANISGVSIGYQEGIGGVVVPSPPQLAGRTAIMLLSSNTVSIIRLQLFSPTNPGQNLFTTLTIAPLFSGASAGAAYSYSGQTAQWDFTTASKLVVGSTYTVSTS